MTSTGYIFYVIRSFSFYICITDNRLKFSFVKNDIIVVIL